MMWLRGSEVVMRGMLVVRTGGALALRAVAALVFVASALRPATAQAINRDSLRSAIETAMAQSDWAAIDRAAAALRAATQAAPGRSDAWLQYDLAYALHRRASALIIEDRARDARTMLEEAVAAAGRARTLGGGAAAQALEGAVTGQLAGATGGLGMMRHGRASLRLLDEAVAAAPNDPRVAMLNGITRVNAPAFAGGGAARGEAELRRALRLFETDRSATPLPTWGRVDAHIWLAIALERQDKLNEARAELERALQLAPGHRWIVEELQPALAKRR